MIQRRRVAVELLVLGVLAVGFLLLFPRRPLFVDIEFALFALGLVLLNVKYTRTRIWDQWQLEHVRARWQRCVLVTMMLTGPAVLLFLLMGIVIGYRGAGWPGVAARILHWKIPVAILLYLPWAFLQQTLFQFYLLGRVRVLSPSLRPLTQSALNGLLFGLVHVPDTGIALLTALGGTIWSLLYLRYHLLWPLAVSHALVAPTFYYWVYGHDLVSRWSPLLTGLLNQE